jgi:hypothetical protein
MTFLNIEMFEQLEDTQRKIFAAAKEVLIAINDSSPIEGFEYLEPTSYDEGDIKFTGKEYRGHGSYDHVEYTMDDRYLYDEKFYWSEIEKLREIEAEKRRQAIARLDLKDKEKAQRELKQLKFLQGKYSHDNG